MSWIPSSADDAIRLWLALQAGGDQLRSLSLVDSEEVCARPSLRGICGGKQSRKGRLGREMLICASCGQPWRGVVVPIVEPKHRRKAGTMRVKGAPPRMRREGLAPLERAAEQSRQLEQVFETRPRDMSRADWAFCLLAFWLSTEGHGRSYLETVEVGVARYPHAQTEARWWSEWKVREACQNAREIIETRLAKLRRGTRWVTRAA